LPTLRSLIGHVLNPRRALTILRDRRAHPWTSTDAVRRRQYGSYAEYVAHQKQKLDANPSEWLLAHEQEYPEVLAKRLQGLGVVKPGMTVLCLAARLGGEVRAFIGLGCFAVGLDLNPGNSNKYVLTGDFHDLQFGAGTVDLLFCNALDHAYDIPKMMAECRRVLKPDGHLILEIVNGETQGYEAGHFEAIIWDKVDDVVSVVCQSGFTVVRRQEIEHPWQGEIMSLSPSPRSES